MYLIIMRRLFTAEEIEFMIEDGYVFNLKLIATVRALHIYEASNPEDLVTASDITDAVEAAVQDGDVLIAVHDESA